MTRQTINFLFVLNSLVMVSFLSLSCSDSSGRTQTPQSTIESIPPDQMSGKVAIDGMRLLYDSVKAEGLFPPQGARIYVYGGISIYEAMVAGSTIYQSLGGQLNDMPQMPLPEAGQEYDWPCSVVAALTTTAKTLFEEATPETLATIDAYYNNELAFRKEEGIADEVINRSVAYGHSVGDAIMAWADGDHYFEIHDKVYTPPAGPGLWVPAPPNNEPALEPYWGDLRTFALTSSDECAPSAPPAYSEDPNSEFYQQANFVYETWKNLTEEQKTIAKFWADLPQETGTPAGHWVKTLAQLTEEKNMPLDFTTETFAMLGVATGDAFIACWRTKYIYNIERPVSYIQRAIQPDWLPYVDTPPFPAYTSGHSTSSGAVSLVLTDIWGTVAYDDKSHVDRGFAPRHYESFVEAGHEASNSRIYGGIHYPMDRDAGFPVGECIGSKILERVRTRK